MKISILDYNAGNLASVYNFFYNLGLNVKIIKNPKEIKNSNRLVVPGVGSAKYAINYLRKEGLLHEIKDFLKTGNPILGICLGFQIFAKTLYENGKSSGVGFINADVLPFSNNNKMLNTHVGWNKVQGNSQLLKKLNIKPNSYFYFCHSFYLNINNENNIKYSHTTFKKKFPSILVKDNFVGTQFHPEKSQNNGTKIIKNFLGL